MIDRLFFITIFLSMILSACGAVRSESIPTTGQDTPGTAMSLTPEQITPTILTTKSPTPAEETRFQPTWTSEPTETTVPTPTITPDTRLMPEDWQKWPVIPTVSNRVQEIYQKGQALGNFPDAFIKIGDCESTPTWFLGDFDKADYKLAATHQDLRPVIDHFQGSYERTSLAAKSGFNAASVLSPFWADPQQCEKMETPLDCEIRIMNPSIALITLGTNDVWHEEKFEENLVAIVENLMEKGVVPVLATKADNLEGDHAINLIIARVAYDYDLPLWNFWLAVQELPDEGLQEDLAHLTWAPNRFDDPLAMQKAWPNRNLTALQTLQSIWTGLQ